MKRSHILWFVAPLLFLSIVECGGGGGSVAQGTGWDTPVPLENEDAGDALSPQVAAGGSGEAFAVWSQSDGTRFNVLASRYVPGSGWDNAVLLESDDAGDAVSPRVAVDGNGNAVAVWSQSDGTRNNIWAIRYAAGTGWEGNPVLIEQDDAGDAKEPRVAVAGDGNAVAVWSQRDGIRFNIWASRYVPGAGWDTATLIENDDAGGAEKPDIAVDRNGNIIAVWQQNNGFRFNAWANRYVPSSGWGAPVLIETDDSGGTFFPQVSFGGDGSAFAVWTQFDGVRNNIWANRYDPGAGWDNAVLLETENLGGAFSPQVAVDNAGNAIAVWFQFNGTQFDIYANRYATGQGWDNAATLVEHDNAGNTNDPVVAFDAGGNAVAAWSQSDGTRFTIRSNRYVPGAGWGNPDFVENDAAGDGELPRIAVGGNGSATVVWQKYDGTRYSIFANRSR